MDAVNQSKSISSTMLVGVQAGDQTAWERFVEVWGPVVYRWCRKRNISANDASDIMQDVLLQVLEKVGDFQRGTFRGWIWTITYHKISDFFRSKHNRPSLIGAGDADLADAPTSEGDESEVIDTNRLVVRQVLGAIKNDFQEHTFEAFWRTTAEGQSAAAVAEDLGMTPAAVRRAKFRVLTRLREELKGMI